MPDIDAVERTLQALREALASRRYTVASLSDGTGILLNLEKKEVLSFNESGMAVVRALQAGTAPTARALGALLEAEFDVDADSARADVELFAERLRRALGADG